MPQKEFVKQIPSLIFIIILTSTTCSQFKIQSSIPKTPLMKTAVDFIPCANTNILYFTTTLDQNLYSLNTDTTDQRLLYDLGQSGCLVTCSRSSQQLPSFIGVKCKEEDPVIFMERNVSLPNGENNLEKLAYNKQRTGRITDFSIAGKYFILGYNYAGFIDLYDIIIGRKVYSYHLDYCWWRYSSVDFQGNIIIVSKILDHIQYPDPKVGRPYQTTRSLINMKQPKIQYQANFDQNYQITYMLSEKNFRALLHLTHTKLLTTLTGDNIQKLQYPLSMSQLLCPTFFVYWFNRTVEFQDPSSYFDIFNRSKELNHTILSGSCSIGLTEPKLFINTTEQIKILVISDLLLRLTISCLISISLVICTCSYREAEVREFLRNFRRRADIQLQLISRR